MIGKLLNSKIFSALIVIFAGWLALSLFGVEHKNNFFDKEIQSVENKIKNVQKTNNELSEFLSHLDNSSFLKKEARLKLNYKAPDEELIFVYGENSTKTASGSALAPVKEGFFKKIFRKLARVAQW